MNIPTPEEIKKGFEKFDKMTPDEITRMAFTKALSIQANKFAIQYLSKLNDKNSAKTFEEFQTEVEDFYGKMSGIFYSSFRDAMKSLDEKLEKFLTEKIAEDAINNPKVAQK